MGSQYVEKGMKISSRMETTVIELSECLIFKMQITRPKCYIKNARCRYLVQFWIIIKKDMEKFTFAPGFWPRNQAKT